MRRVLQNDLEAGYDRISQRLDVQYKGKIQVIMYSNQADYIKETKMPGWSTGAYFSKGLLLQPQITSHTAVHELVHVMINQINNDTPRWLNEGISPIKFRHIPVVASKIRRNLWR